MYRSHVRFTIFTIVLVLIISFLFVLCAHAQKTKSTTYATKEKYFTSLYIEAGETLWHIASVYADKDYYSSNREYIKEIMEINNLKSDRIQQGSYLLVTYYQ